VPAIRIATLLPSATEIVCALGLADRVVGVSHECDFPPEIAGRPVLTEPKIDPHRGSKEIDADVRALVRDGLSVYRIREDELRAARPDLIVTQQQCEVCAVSFDEVKDAAARVLDAPAEIVSLEPNRLDDVLADFERVAGAADCGDAGRALVESCRERFDRIRRRAAHVKSRPRVVCLEWLDPLMAAGNWIPELIDLAAGTCAIGTAGEHSPTISWQDLADAAPDVVILMPCGFKLGQTRRELPELTARAEWRSLPAVRNGRVYAVDGNAYMNRPGPRIVESAEILAGLIQPGQFAHLLPAGSWERVADAL
jgi:iron complex transport system substrate-binding protein